MLEAQTIEIIMALRPEILKLLESTDWTNSKKGQRTVRNINSIFRQTDIDITELFPEELGYSYRLGAEEIGSTFGHLGLDRRPQPRFTQSDYPLGEFVHVEALANINEDSVQDLKSAIETTRRYTNHSVNSVLDEYVETMQSGMIRGNTRKELTNRVIKNFEERGFTSFVTSDGKELPLDFYAQTIVRTNLNKAQTEGSLNSWKLSGGDLVQIGGHTPTCAECWTHRGVVFSMSGHKIFPTLKDKPPFHPNCQCTVQSVEEDYWTDEERAEAINKANEYKRNKVFNKDSRSDEMKKAYKDDQDLKRRLNADKKEYAKIKATLGDDAPKTLGGYRRSKRSNSASYMKLKKDYKEALKPAPPVKVTNYKSIVIDELDQVVKESIELYETKLKDEYYERGALFNDKGENVWSQKGNRDSVTITDAINKDLLRGNVFTHNHPRSSSFSPEDLNVMLAHDLKEIRAIGSNGNLYRARPPTNPQVRLTSREKLREEVNYAESEVRNKLTKLIVDGSITNDEANVEHWNSVWEIVAPKLRIKYERIKPYD